MSIKKPPELKPQVLFIVDNEFSSCVRLKNQVTVLAAKGVDCHVISFSYKKYQPIQREVKAGVNIYTVHTAPFVHHFRTLSAELPVFRWFVTHTLKKIVRRWGLQPKAIHCYNTFAWRGVHRFSKVIKEALLVIDFAEDLPSIMGEYDYVKRGLGSVLVNLRQWEMLQAHAVKFANICLVVTPEAAENYVHRYKVDGSKFIPINNFPSESLIHKAGITNKIKRQNFTVLYFGDTSVRRGTDILIRTAPEIKKIIPEYEVLIIGQNNREQPKLHAMVAEMKCSAYVRLLGYQPENDLPKYMASASLGTSPLKRNAHHDTTHANKLFQFMLGGLPLLVSDCKAQANLVRKHDLGVVFEANNDAGFIQAVQQAYSKRNHYKTWEKNCLNYMKKHSLKAALTPYAELIKNLQEQ